MKNLFADLLGEDEDDESTSTFDKPAPRTGASLLRVGTAAELLNISRSTIYRLVQQGDFPKPIRIGSGRFWVKSELLQWMRDRLADR